MYAIVKSGGKQYRVEEGQSLLVERLHENDGTRVGLQPLLYVDGSTIVDGDGLSRVKVEARVVAHERGPKLRVVKFKPKRGYKRRTGHRQELTRLEVTSVKLAARRGAAKQEPKPVAAEPKPVAAEPAPVAAAPKPVAAEPAPVAGEPAGTAAAPAEAPAKKPAARRSTARKPAAAKAEGAKAARGKAAAEKADGGKAEGAKPAARKAPARKPPARKPPARKPRTPKPKTEEGNGA